MIVMFKKHLGKKRELQIMCKMSPKTSYVDVKCIK